MNAYANEDPPKQPKLAVPITVPHHILQKGRKHTASGLAAAVGDLCVIAFYFLLRVGEYTNQGTGNLRKQTVRFRVKDVTFRNNGRIIKNNAPLCALHKATHATLCINNQKNGVRGQCITLDCNKCDTSPIRALARRIHHIVSNTPADIDVNCITISTYFLKDGYPMQVTPTHISNAVKDACEALGLDEAGFTRNKVSSHSLRAGGAMALKLNGADCVTIKKQGRWSSNTFMMYIHEQISALSEGLTASMSKYIPFTNMAGGPNIIEPDDELLTTPN